MTTHNLGSSTDYGGDINHPDLDFILKQVLDTVEGSDITLGQAIDRLQHLSACRRLMARYGIFATWFSDDGSDRRVNLDRDKILQLRAMGRTYEQIAAQLGCSVGAAHKYAKNNNASRSAVIQAGASA